ncbi:agmatine/peptidylarginine deiminase [Bacillus sp. B1-b2]|uniref:agmatine deiminase family protein n=1 Tax=Bacillus sp. B1-b2 TaxID=2653201 RepID=UPI001262404C|nr:agmatine deiminase family protein [Bacillus sp. B1-b2]KAB7670750.1 agmatine deiminase family protein [Bacillus sp. B1-b2]
MLPIELNYRMPAEWDKHERTFISWPVKDSMVFPDDYEAVSKGYAELIHAISEFEPVTIVVNPDEADAVQALFEDKNNIDTLAIEHNDAWLRDNGPTFLINDDKKVAAVNWQFNAWGGKYSPWDLDNEVAPKILEKFQIEKFDAPLVMEGGSIHVDGEGTVITTEECLLNTNRNSQLSKEEIEEQLKAYLNVKKVIWLKSGLSGDETDGHVDNVACFVAPGKIMMQVCNDPADENYTITQENIAILESETDALGRKLEIIPIEQPPIVMHEDSRLTLSYINFYFVNDGIILPVFGGTAEEADKNAEKVLQDFFPDRKIRTINGMAIIREGGNVHCTTQQMVLGNQ